VQSNVKVLLQEARQKGASEGGQAGAGETIKTSEFEVDEELIITEKEVKKTEEIAKALAVTNEVCN
jgi:hypothetical protein